ncbi:hypothetical protein Tco_0789547, partial [Tanacetum coccineum]
YELPPSLFRFLCQALQYFRRHASHTELFDQEVESFSWQRFGKDVSQLCPDIWSLNEDILKITILTTNTPYPSGDTAYRACPHNDQKERRSILHIERYIRMTKVIKGEFEKIMDVKVEDVSLTCDTPLEVFYNEVNQLSGMDDDLFTYEVEVANIPYDSKMDDDSEHEADDDVGYDPSDIRGDDEVELTDEESSDDTVMLLDYEWYEALKDSELKDKALRNKVIMEGFINEVDDDKLPVKEDKYDDLTITREEACRAYQEIFRIMDEGWMVTKAK